MTKYIQQYKVFASVEPLNRWLKKNVSYVENEDEKQTSVTPEYNFLVSYLKVDRDA